jgi:FkbM family methyltransferase
MTGSVIGRLANALPPAVLHHLRRRRYSLQIRLGRFHCEEPEYRELERWVSEQDCVVDVGANVGHYTLRLAQLVGKRGRVIAVEPVPRNFELLAANVVAAGCSNVSLFNMALSESTDSLGMHIPRRKDGRFNDYRAAISGDEATLTVPATRLDALQIPGPVSLIKLDVEGHELQVLRGARQTIRDFEPVVIAESQNPHVERFFRELGYGYVQLDGSPNRVFSPGDGQALPRLRQPGQAVISRGSTKKYTEMKWQTLPTSTNR